MQETVQVHIAIVALYDFCFRLQCSDNLPYAFQFVLVHLACLVEQDDVAELYLLNDQVLYVFLADVLVHQSFATLELILHAQGIHYGHYAVQFRYAIASDRFGHSLHGADGLGYGCWFTNATCFDNQIVEALHLYDVLYLLHEVHLQRTAYTSVLQSHQAVVLLVHDTTLLNQAGVDIYFSDIVDNHCKAYASLVGKDSVEQGGLSATQITGEQEYREVDF